MSFYRPDRRENEQRAKEEKNVLKTKKKQTNKQKIKVPP